MLYSTTDVISDFKSATEAGADQVTIEYVIAPWVPSTARRLREKLENVKNSDHLSKVTDRVTHVTNKVTHVADKVTSQISKLYTEKAPDEANEISTGRYTEKAPDEADEISTGRYFAQVHQDALKTKENLERIKKATDAIKAALYTEKECAIKNLQIFEIFGYINAFRKFIGDIVEAAKQAHVVATEEEGFKDLSQSLDKLNEKLLIFYESPRVSSVTAKCADIYVNTGKMDKHLKKVSAMVMDLRDNAKLRAWRLVSSFKFGELNRYLEKYAAFLEDFQAKYCHENVDSDFSSKLNAYFEKKTFLEDFQAKYCHKNVDSDFSSKRIKTEVTTTISSSDTQVNDAIADAKALRGMKTNINRMMMNGGQTDFENFDVANYHELYESDADDADVEDDITKPATRRLARRGAVKKRNLS